MRDSKLERDEILARAAMLVARPPRDLCIAHQREVRAYRTLVAEVNALTDSDMELALVTR